MTETLQNLLHSGLERLKTTSDSPRLDAELLLCHVLDISRAQLYANPNGLVDEDEAADFQSLIARRAQHIPLAHLTGYREFWSVPLRVTPDVLVPRPETELLVEKTLELIPVNAELDILDLGTGSGAIPIALSTERSACRYVATDISDAALAVARDNAGENAEARIEFLIGSWFEPLGERHFDIIVSNPPYVAANKPELTGAELAHEPAGALYSGPDGLDDIRSIVAGAPHRLKPGGWLLIEHGFDQAAEITDLFKQAGFENISTDADLAGHPRVTSGQTTTYHG
jgi:release factor glutamine methyltransferase